MGFWTLALLGHRSLRCVVGTSRTQQFHFVVLPKNPQHNNGTARIYCCAPCCCSARRPPLSIDISCPPGPQQQTSRTLLQRSIDGTDRWTYGRTAYRYVYIYIYAAHYASSVNKVKRQSISMKNTLKLSVLGDDNKHYSYAVHTEDKICYTAAHVDPVPALSIVHTECGVLHCGAARHRTAPRATASGVNVPLWSHLAAPEFPTLTPSI